MVSGKEPSFEVTRESETVHFRPELANVVRLADSRRGSRGEISSHPVGPHEREKKKARVSKALHPSSVNEVYFATRARKSCNIAGQLA